MIDPEHQKLKAILNASVRQVTRTIHANTKKTKLFCQEKFNASTRPPEEAEASACSEEAEENPET